MRIGLWKISEISRDFRGKLGIAKLAEWFQTLIHNVQYFFVGKGKARDGEISEMESSDFRP